MSTPEIAAEAVTENLPDALGGDGDPRPTLYRDSAFWGMTVTQFLGAFNDNLFKQLVLLLSIAGVDEAHRSEAADNQGLAMFLFAAPFLAFTGYAGFLADRFSKRTIVVSCKVAEVAVMALGGLGFMLYASTGSMWGLYSVLFLMAAQSAFFGPAKFGILPEMLRDVDLPRANGFMLMTTFLAIIFGTAVAGVLLDQFGERLWVGSAACILLAIMGTVSSLWVRRVRVANPQLRFSPEALTVPRDMINMLRGDRPLLMALAVSSVFWLLAGMVPSAVNALGKIALNVGDQNTSILSATIGVGIAVGCAIGGLVSGGRVDFRLLRVGSGGLLVCLAIVAIPAGGDV
ncbi:MAG TPA: MFS transporter, partial [Lacipirellulaceae bacterium]|nr:MFS transporter [Lacipirellulaceae bacterium]